MLVDLDLDAPCGSKSPITINTRAIRSVTPGGTQGISGSQTTVITFIDGTDVRVIGTMSHILEKLRGIPPAPDLEC
jgi:hypothetical protein